MTFRPDKDGDPIPDIVNVDLTIEELVWITLVAGELRGCDKPPRFDLYDPAVGDVLNRYWEDGVDGAASELSVKNVLVNQAKKNDR